MKSKVKSAKGRRNKGASGEREIVRLIERNCPGLAADRNARNGKATSNVLVWERKGLGHQHPYLFEVKRVESLDIGTKAMTMIREQAEKDGAAGIFWRKNGGTWRLDVPARAWAGSALHYRWATFSGDDVWRVLQEIVG